jgi:hypothetical protein
MSPFPFRRKPVVSGTPSGVVVCTACGKPSPGLLGAPGGMCSACRLDSQAAARPAIFCSRCGIPAAVAGLDSSGLCAVCRYAWARCGKCGAALPSDGTCAPCSLAAMMGVTINQMNAGMSSLAGSLSSFSFGSVTASGPASLETVEQDDLLQGTKYATLWMTKDGKPSFRGTGYCGVKSEYSTESYASCGDGCSHDVPAADCKCGFWIPTEKSALSVWHRPYVRLEVEFGGRVMDCGRDPLPAPPWGWRAQWQRVLSVTLSPHCAAHAGCSRKPVGLVAERDTGQVLTSCDRPPFASRRVISRPVSWLREGLQTEIRPGTVTDDPAPEEPAERALPPGAHLISRRQMRITGAAVSTCARSYAVPFTGIVQVDGVTVYGAPGPGSQWHWESAASPRRYTAVVQADGTLIVTETWEE